MQCSVWFGMPKRNRTSQVESSRGAMSRLVAWWDNELSVESVSSRTLLRAIMDNGRQQTLDSLVAYGCSAEARLGFTLA